MEKKLYDQGENKSHNFNIEMGQRLQKIRKLKGLSQEDISIKMGITRTSIVNMEAGRQGLTAINIGKMCKILDISPADIFPDTYTSISITVDATISELKEEVKTWRSKYLNLISLLEKIKDHIKV